MKRRFWFGCPHEFSFPIKSSDGSYYQVCTLCGAEYGYDWKRMKRTKPLARRVQQTSLDQCRPDRHLAALPASADADTSDAANARRRCRTCGCAQLAKLHQRSAVRSGLVANAVESWAAAAKRWSFSSRRRIRLAPVVALVVFLAFTYVVVHRSGRAVPEQKSPEVAAPVEVAAHSETSIETAVSNEAAPEAPPTPSESDHHGGERKLKHLRCAACSNAGFGRG